MTAPDRPLSLVVLGEARFGHISPMMPLADAARDAGHRVTFATGKAFVPTLHALGFETWQAEITTEVMAAAAVRFRDPNPEPGPDRRIGMTAFVEVGGIRTAPDLLPIGNQAAV